MDFGTFFPVAVILVTLILVSRGIRVVQQAQTIVIERLGRYHRTLHSGMNLILPILDKPRAIDWRFTQVTPAGEMLDRKSTRLNSSHGYISYAVFCLKKKKKNNT